MTPQDAPRCETVEHLSTDDRAYIETDAREAYCEMETHLEIFTLPSGKELWVWCDGRYRIVEPRGNK